MVKVTGEADPAPRAATPEVAPAAGAQGGADVNEIDWASFAAPFAVIACWAWGAAWYLPLPAWLASMTQLPSWPKVTVDPEIEHAELVEDGSMLKVTGFPEPPPRAATT